MREAGEQKNKPKCAGQWIGFLTLPIRTRSERTFTRSSRRIQRFFSKNKPSMFSCHHACCREFYLQLSIQVCRMGSRFPRRLCTSAQHSSLQSHLLRARGGHSRGKARKPSVRPRQIGVWQQCAPGWQASSSP